MIIIIIIIITKSNPPSEMNLRNFLIVLYPACDLTSQRPLGATYFLGTETCRDVAMPLGQIELLDL